MLPKKAPLNQSLPYHSIKDVDNTFKDPLVNLTLLIINYTERENVRSYQYQIDILIHKVLEVLEQDTIAKDGFYFQQSILDMYLRDFISNIHTVYSNEETAYHLGLLSGEISSISNNINLKIQTRQNSSLKIEWTQRKKYIELIINQFLLENKIPIFELISKPLELNKNHSLIDLFYNTSIILTLIGIIFLLIAIFKDNT